MILPNHDRVRTKSPRSCVQQLTMGAPNHLCAPTHYRASSNHDQPTMCQQTCADKLVPTSSQRGLVPTNWARLVPAIWAREQLVTTCPHTNWARARLLTT